MTTYPDNFQASCHEDVDGKRLICHCRTSQGGLLHLRVLQLLHAGPLLLSKKHCQNDGNDGLGHPNQQHSYRVAEAMTL